MSLYNWRCSSCKSEEEQACAYTPYYGFICMKCIVKHGVNAKMIRKLNE